MTTRIKIKKGAGTPSGLTFGELAYDLTNKKLFIGITGGNALLANTDGGVASFNGLTGAVAGVTVGGTNVFTALNSFNAGISASGGVTLAGTFSGTTGSFSKLLTLSNGLSAAGGATFATDISVNSIRVGRGAGNQLYNVVLGSDALTLNTSGNYNLAIGAEALASNLTGIDNVGIGYAALFTNTSSNNLGIGSSSLAANSSGSDNVGVGTLSLANNSTGSRNVGIGRSALSLNGNDNVAIGGYALSNITAATLRNQNTAIGSDAGRYRTGGSNLQGATGGIYIGYGARASANAQTNEIVIGTLAEALGSNTAVIGATTQTAATIYGLLNTPGGISSAGGTFSALTIFTAGISAAGGMTLAGSFQGSTATFSGLGSFSAGISAAGGMTLAGSFQGSTATFSGLGSFTAGISASGATFSGPIQSTRLARLTSAVFEAKSANWSPTNADDGKIFTVSIGGKSTITCTVDGLSAGTHFKILLSSGSVNFSSTSGTFVGYQATYGMATPSSATLYCTSTNNYFVTDSA